MQPTERQDCPHAAGCDMFDLFTQSSILAVWKLRYCSGDYEKCERYLRSREGRDVPRNLMPSGVLLRKGR